MGAQLRVYKRRIRAVTATKKITKAMEMIAASRIVKAQRKVAASMPYATELTRAVTAVATGSNTKHALTTEVEAPMPCRGPAHHERPRSGRRLLLERHQAGGAAHRAAARRGQGGRHVHRRPQGSGLLRLPRAQGRGVVDRLHRQPGLRRRQARRGAADRGHPDGDGRGRRRRAAHRLHGIRVDDDAERGGRPDAAAQPRQGSRRRPARRARSFRCSTSSRRRRTSSTPFCRATSRAASTTHCCSRPLPSTPPAAAR